MQEINEGGDSFEVEEGEKKKRNRQGYVSTLNKIQSLDIMNKVYNAQKGIGQASTVIGRKLRDGRCRMP
ncbi:Helicase C-terminal [Penicillium fimorum]|uniref:Helicase C-terminal n=1 Tax=Penicillium fimorum TaxID=1882269 RepID=A0A9W9Y295_9EURO|nr:Helicase C-terminal [Penicillium fimorum]